MEDIGFEIPTNLEVHPLGDNGEMEILPASGKNVLSSSQLPCGLPPILPDTNSMLNSFLDDLEKLPILQLDAVQRFIPIKPNISSLFSVDLCPLQTTLSVKRNVMTGKLLGFTEEVKDAFEGTHKTSSSLSRAPGPPDAGVKGTSSGLPFWPGGMDEPVTHLLKADSLNTSIFEGALLDTPPGFSQGMKFERKTYDEVDYVRSQPQEIYLSDVLAMDDSLDLDLIEKESKKQSVEALETEQKAKQTEVEGEESLLKLAYAPVLKISESEPKKQAHYDWAVIENINEPVEDFYEKITKLPHWNFDLDPFQKRAILHLEKKENVFVAAHTSAGKTVVAEYAISLAKKNFSRVIYTSPIKALSNQKFRDFQDTFGDVGLITGDVQENPGAFCLIMTTEILRSMLYHGSDLIRELEWVVFDEVHYINDPERGVVWEEVFIMLPDHVNLIMLSATVPNTAEFAEWLGSIKKRKIFVISTLYRPVPLVFELYTGSVGKSEDERFMIINEKGLFLDNMYIKALNAKKERESKYKATTGAKGPKYTVNPSQDKNIYIGLLHCLQKHDLMPAVCFMFSRKRCNNMIELLKSENLVTREESGRIVTFFNKSIKDLLPDADKDLSQVQMMKECLSRGFGVHHSGILPILKEVVEMLVKNKLVKVLFATETFAMGVNMPTKTVVFDSIQKHDGTSFRDLQPSEFIQMAGRAGRRNIDEKGTVIVLCKGNVPDVFSLKHMMQGQPTKLESQFKLTYSMILNLLKIKTLRVEDVMKRSFGESSSEKNKKEIQQSLAGASSQLASKTRPECSLCNMDILDCMETLKEVEALKVKIMPKMCTEGIARKIFTPGRIVLTSYKNEMNVPGVLLSIDKEKCKVLVVSSQAEASDSTSSPETKPWSHQVYFPHSKKPELATIPFTDVSVIANKTIKIQEQEVMREMKQMGAMKAKYSIMSAFQDLCSVAEANLNGFDAANINIKDMDVVNDICQLKDLEKKFENFTCLKCPDISNHFSLFSEYEKLHQEVELLKYKLSEQSLSLHPEFEKRKKVLKALEYIDSEENVQLKGSVAREMSNHELLITELLVKSVFNDCEPEEVAALLSCMVFQQRCHEELLLPSQLKKKVIEIIDVATEIARRQHENEIDEPDFVEQYNFHLVNIVYEWARGTSFADIKNSTDIDEGIIVHSIRRLVELLKDVKNGATLVGDPSLAKKMENASQLIKRGIVYMNSLYVKSSKPER